ncbi:hypothetical protein JCM13210_15160 [Thermaerobacter litoralis]
MAGRGVLLTMRFVVVLATAPVPPGAVAGAAAPAVAAARRASA